MIHNTCGLKIKAIRSHTNSHTHPPQTPKGRKSKTNKLLVVKKLEKLIGLQKNLHPVNIRDFYEY